MIVQMNPLKLKTAIQERYAGLIKPGQAVEFMVEAFPTRTFAGKVAYVSPAVDQATRTFTVGDGPCTTAQASREPAPPAAGRPERPRRARSRSRAREHSEPII